jgi:hypothetical protein
MSEPIKHDGWKSRKVIISGVAWMCLFGATVAAVAGDHTTFDKAVEFMQWATPGILGPLFVGLGIDKLAESKRQ